MTPQEHAALLDELADEIPCEVDSYRLGLKSRARAAAAELKAAPVAERQYYAYHPEEGVELCATQKEAQSLAARWLEDDRHRAADDCWHEEQESLSWGYLVPVEAAQVTKHRLATAEDAECFSNCDEGDEIVSYELQPVLARFGGGGVQ